MTKEYLPPRKSKKVKKNDIHIKIVNNERMARTDYRVRHIPSDIEEVVTIIEASNWMLHHPEKEYILLEDAALDLVAKRMNWIVEP